MAGWQADRRRRSLPGERLDGAHALPPCPPSLLMPHAWPPWCALLPQRAMPRGALALPSFPSSPVPLLASCKLHICSSPCILLSIPCKLHMCSWPSCTSCKLHKCSCAMMRPWCPSRRVLSPPVVSSPRPSCPLIACRVLSPPVMSSPSCPPAKCLCAMMRRVLSALHSGEGTASTQCGMSARHTSAGTRVLVAHIEHTRVWHGCGLNPRMWPEPSSALHDVVSGMA